MTAPATVAIVDPARSIDAVLADPRFRAWQAGWRRRIAASWRLPPVDCGHRDPLDCPRPEPAAGVDYCCARLGMTRPRSWRRSVGVAPRRPAPWRRHVDGR